MKIVEGRGNRHVYIQLQSIDENTRRGIRQGFFKLGSSLVRTASKQILKKDKTGRVYLIRRGKTRRRHRASAAGQSPANLSGENRRSLGFKIKGAEQMNFGGNKDYTPHLEEGTRHMEPRPGLGNSVKAEERNSVTYFQNEIAKYNKV